MDITPGYFENFLATFYLHLHLTLYYYFTQISNVLVFCRHVISLKLKKLEMFWVVDMPFFLFDKVSNSINVEKLP